jgi:hypothetical protein
MIMTRFAAAVLSYPSTCPPFRGIIFRAMVEGRDVQGSPNTFLPYIFFSLMTLKRLHMTSSVSINGIEWKLILDLKIFHDWRGIARYMKQDSLPFGTRHINHEKPPSTGTAGRVVLG